MSDEWDDEAKVTAEFPKDKYEWIPVKNSDHAGQLISERMFNSSKASPMFGEARWFGPGRGVLLLPIEENAKLAESWEQANPQTAGPPAPEGSCINLTLVIFVSICAVCLVASIVFWVYRKRHGL